jgi:cytochrome o ubiquinol oxidase subunit 1
MVLAGLATACGFAMIWHIWWMVIASFMVMIGSAIAHTFNYDRDYYISADDVAKIEDARTQQLAQKA